LLADRPQLPAEPGDFAELGEYAYLDLDEENFIKLELNPPPYRIKGMWFGICLEWWAVEDLNL
jgi:hypothetical protein